MIRRAGFSAGNHSSEEHLTARNPAGILSSRPQAYPEDKPSPFKGLSSLVIFEMCSRSGQPKVELHLAVVGFLTR